MITMNTVGAKLAQIRESRKLSPAQLAERSDVPEELVRQIEAGDLIPSLSPLLKLGRALGVRLGTFLDDAENLGPIIHRKDQRTQAVRFAGPAKASSGELAFYALALDKAGRHMEPFLIDLLPGTEASHPLSTHEGEEFIYVLIGRFVISIEGRDPVTFPPAMAPTVRAHLPGACRAPVTFSPRGTAMAACWFVTCGSDALCLRLADEGQVRLHRRRQGIWTED